MSMDIQTQASAHASPGPSLAASGPLSELPTNEWLAVKDWVRFREARAGENLFSPGRVGGELMFVADGAVTLLTQLDDGFSIEALLAGPGDCLGWLEAVSGDDDGAAAYCLTPTRVATIGFAHFERVAPDAPTLARLAHRSAALMALRMQRAIACQAAHTVTQRFASWLLQLRAVHGADTIPLTQAWAARSLGVQRTTVTSAAAELKALGALRIRRARVEILSPDVMRRASCGCAP